MKNIFLLLTAILLTQLQTFAQAEELELKPSQSMCITGKGPGQDGAINPYYGQDCYAIVSNIGTSNFSIRTQQKGEILKTIPIKKGEVKRVKLLVGHELYFDTEEKGDPKVTVAFEKITN